ncbi:MAG TPA: hypothetical protein VEQ42_05030 [Pyrinomonadaceae bacterium]|nr:hypothetical protein [Pyrinomonadaceae bacterium]
MKPSRSTHRLRLAAYCLLVPLSMLAAAESARACVELSPAGRAADRSLRILDYTEEDGRYTLTGVPSGSYHLVGNSGGRLSADEPVPVASCPPKQK